MVRIAPFPSPRSSSRRWLLAGVSIFGLLAALQPAEAANSLAGKGGTVTSPATAAVSAAQNSMATANAAAQRSRNSLARAAQNIQAMRAAQDAARNLALAAPSVVPDGLAPGGLNPVANPNSTTDGLTDWIGAGMPDASPTNANDVTIHQTQKNAILSWQSFNVGKDTTLTFDQKGNTDWIALNRVVDPGAAPSKIMGRIKADGTVLVINRNGILFTGTAQINTHSLISSTLDVGPMILPDPTSTNGSYISSTVAMRNQNFLQNGLLGYKLATDEYGDGGTGASATFSALGATKGDWGNWTAGSNNGTVSVEAGASIETKGDGGLILLAAPHVINAGTLSSPVGQVILTAAETSLTLTPSSGTGTDSIPRSDTAQYNASVIWAASDANVRGVVPLPQGHSNRSDYFVWNQANGIIEAAAGNVYLRAPGSMTNNPNGMNDSVGKDNGGGTTIGFGAAYNDGALVSTTSVSRNGSIIVYGGDVRFGSESLMTILPDTGGETIPQSPSSLAGFKSSAIRINGQTIEMEGGSFLLAPGADVQIGYTGSMVTGATGLSGYQSILINAGAEINVAGLTDVLIPASDMQVVIDPAKKNELRDSPLYRNGFLNGATVYLDPRLSGVRDDGVAWIGSPLIDAAAYYQLVGAGPERLMTKGGTVSIGTRTGGNLYDPSTGYGMVYPSAIIREGAVIDMSGGWVTYEAGFIKQTLLVRSDGRVIPIGSANPDDLYVGVYEGFVRNHAKWGVTEIWGNRLQKSERYVPSYTEGRDAGVLTLTTPTLVLDATLRGQAYAGQVQIDTGKTGSGTSAIKGDERAVQGATSELPAGGALIVNGSSDIRVVASLPDLAGGEYGNTVRGEIIENGDGSYSYTRPTNNASNPPLPAERMGVLLFSGEQLSNAGLSQVSLLTTVEVKDPTSGLVPPIRTSYGTITIDEGADIVLNPGGVFHAEGSRIEIDGTITIPSGKITLRTDLGKSTLDPSAGILTPDIVVSGDLSVAGRWVNEYGNFGDAVEGFAWLNGGTISMDAGAAQVVVHDIDGIRQDSYDPVTGQLIPPTNTDWASLTATDKSGSILIDPGARLNLSGGGRIDPTGKIYLGAKGGNLTLKSLAQYYQSYGAYSNASGFRILSVYNGYVGPLMGISVNPDRINARIVFDPAQIQAHGFGGGGTFTLVTPEFALGDGTPTTGAILPFDFFSKAGFANYDITSYKTEFSPSTFTNGYGGYNAVLATQTVTVKAGQTLSLVQSVLPNLLDTAQQSALRGLATGGDVNGVVAPVIPADAWDQRAVNLNLGGMLELHVEQGGRVIGAAGSTLTVGGLLNEGTIRIPGGAVLQRWAPPLSYAWGVDELNAWKDPIGFHSLSDIFAVNADGTIDPYAVTAYKDNYGRPITNQDLVGKFAGNGTLSGRRVYKLGLLDQDQGIVLAAGSVTDLSGTVIYNPRAVDSRGNPIATGKIVGGGTLAALPTKVLSSYAYVLPGYQIGGAITAQAGAMIDLSGVSGAFDQWSRQGGTLAGGIVSTPVWSDGGTLSAAAGGTLAGATIRAGGGSAQALGGVLEFLNPVFTQHDPETPTADVVSADLIARSGFDTLVALGGFTSAGDATVALDRAFILKPATWKYPLNSGSMDRADILSPTISTGGALVIAAPYVGLLNTVDAVMPADGGTPGGGSVTFRAGQIDVTGAIRFDKSVSQATLDASGDIRLIGLDIGWQRQFNSSLTITDPTLKGALMVNGDLTMIARQIYPTTGSSFTITSSAADGTITFGRSGGETPPVPYSAGADLMIQAAHIVQGGVIRVPFGTLTLGGNSVLSNGTGYGARTLAPATETLVLADGGITSVSANGLVIPYGTTTDTMEWYFSPSGNDPLTGPPAKVMTLNGNHITLADGATVDLTGGGDVYAYEFVPGTGGSRDVLNQINGDQYSATKVKGVGYQYPDARQVYAIVPGLSDAPAAVYDPIYSANYADLSSVAGVGKRVWLDGGNGLAAGWYTLLPAQYALLPGGMRVVEQTGAANVVADTSARRPDGTLLVSGTYGDALSGAAQSQVRLFSVQSQGVIRSYSNIVLTSGNSYTLAKAADQGLVAPRIGLDAGRLALNPLASLTVDAIVSAAAAPGGRGSQVDISGRTIEITSTATDPVAAGAIHLTVDSLNNLKAESLLIGAKRTDNGDGTTNLDITANSIVLGNDAAHPLVGPEIVFAVDDMALDDSGKAVPVASELTLKDGAAVIATGTVNDQRSGAYVIDGRVVAVGDPTYSNSLYEYQMPANTAIGALVRVANGPQRVVERLRSAADPELPGNTGTPTGPDANLTIGNVTLEGAAIGFDTSHRIGLGSNAQIKGKDVALGAGGLAFTSRAMPSSVVVITPELQRILSQGEQLTLRSHSSIAFDDGTYAFDKVAFDTATFDSLDGGSVTIEANAIRFGNAGEAGVATGGTGVLNVAAGEITIGSGTVATTGFGGGVNLTARNGLFSGRTDVDAAMVPPTRSASITQPAADTTGVFDVGAADLSIAAPYMGDRGAPGVSADAAAAMTLKTTGAINITSMGTTPLDLAPYPGIPGSSLVIEGGAVTIAGTHLRATAGTLTVKSAGAIALTGGAVLEAPGYARTFGDALDPVTRSAPGGTLSLVALGAGGISLGDATLSVGGGTGNAGTLKLSAANGAVDLAAATLNGAGGEGAAGGTFILETQGAVDLAAMNGRVGADGFTGGFDVWTHAGDLVLAAGQTLKSGSVNLTADGGRVSIAGTIDTSGTNGGTIELYGAAGVSLLATAKLDAHAEGYGADDSRQARAGDITLGTDFVPGSATVQADGSVRGTSGVITIADGAVIDASARRPGDRLVRVMRGGTINYMYVQGDEGGTVAFRAPVVDGGMDVHVARAASVVGARSVDLVGFKRWDLAQVAASGLYKGVAHDGATNTVTLDAAEDLDVARLDATRTATGGVNFLGDEGVGTVVEFVQNYDVSASYGQLGGLATQANFHARPGVDLATTGDIVLASNWNLGAGTVDLASAQAAGYVTRNLALAVTGVETSGYVVKSGFEDDLFAEYTRLIYRTGHGSVTGEAPVVSLRAGGSLDLKGSLTDGFFLFRDQSDQTYRSKLGSGYYATDLALTLDGGQTRSTYQATQWATWNGTVGSYDNYLSLTVGSQGTGYVGKTVDNVTTATIPYTAIGNSPAARGTFAADAGGNIDGGGDPLGSAVVFPLLPDGSAVPSSSYVLAAGAANLAGASVAKAGADPARVNPASTASLTVAGDSTYHVTAGSYSTSDGALAADSRLRVDSNSSFGGTGRPSPSDGLTKSLSFEDWLASVSSISDTAIAQIYIGTNATGNDPNRALVTALFAEFITEQGLVRNSTDPATGYRLASATASFADTASIYMSVANFRSFITEKLIPNQAALRSNILASSKAPTLPGPTTKSVSSGIANSMTRPLIRTGTGDIRLAAAGDVDLTGGPVTYMAADGTVANIVNADGSRGALPTSCAVGTYYCTAQLGGVAVYTAGHRLGAIPGTLPDPVTGIDVTIAMPAPAASVFASAYPFTYTGSYQAGLVLADPLVLTGGGDVAVTAQGSVESRRDLSPALLYNGTSSNVASSYSWAGQPDSLEVLRGQASTALPAQLWRVAKTSTSSTTATINPQLFKEGIGALGGGSVSVKAGGDVSDLTVVSETSLVTAKATSAASSLPVNVLVTAGGGNVAVQSGGDILGARADVGSGALTMKAGRNIGRAAPVLVGMTWYFQFTDLNGTTYRAYNVYDGQTYLGPLKTYTEGETRVRIDDATVELSAGGDLSIAGIGQLDNFYTPESALGLLANGSVTVTNTVQVKGAPSAYAGQGAYAIYPGSLSVTSLAGDVTLRTYAMPPTYSAYDFNGRPVPVPASANVDAPGAIMMAPSPQGQLEIFAAGDIANSKIAMLDMDPNTLPGLFTLGGEVIQKAWGSGYTAPANAAYQWGSRNGSIGFPDVKSTMSDADRKRQHTSTPTHAGDDVPVRIYAGNDIGDASTGLTLSLPKQARIYAGRDIVNMMFFGQNLTADDLTRIAAGRDLVGTITLASTSASGNQPTLHGNTFILGGPGSLMVSAGRNMGPFLNSADIASGRYAGGIVTVGNDWNPYLDPVGADITVMFGAGPGVDYAALREAYVAPGTVANALGGYGAKLVAWMREHAGDALIARFGTLDVDAGQAYAAFAALPELRQQPFLLNVFFNELRAPAVVDGPSYMKYSRGYEAVNALFPASLGYTTNGLEGGAASDSIVRTGDLDLRLAAIESLYGGGINILGPGGRVLAGSVVATAQQASRRNYVGAVLYNPDDHTYTNPVVAIPPGFEGVLTQRGGAINTFTDGDFILNQSRLFTVQGGDITMWSSNADLNAGQGAKTTANFPPVVVRLNENLLVKVDRTSATTGAGIASFPPAVGAETPDVYLLAPRGTVDAGDAGVRSAGDISVVALKVLNSDNFKAAGQSYGIPMAVSPNTGALTAASDAAGSASAAADMAAKGSRQTGARQNDMPSIITVEVIGYGGAGNDEGSQQQPRRQEEERQRRIREQHSYYDPNGSVRYVGVGQLSEDQRSRLTLDEQRKINTPWP